MCIDSGVSISTHTNLSVFVKVQDAKKNIIMQISNFLTLFTTLSINTSDVFYL